MHRPHRVQPHEAPLRILLVSHTHWDREWYHPAGRFRQRLVALVDALLAEESQPHATFLLDGQTIVLEDYASVRPEQSARLRDRLTSGAVEAGPWYVLADNLIPSGEAILRNLEIGRGDLERWGAVPPSVAYCPDTFGHPAFMPAIAAGYGFGLAVAWRGVGGARHPGQDMMWWVAPDGSRVLLHHLPPDGYESGAALPVTRDAAVRRWTRLLETLSKRNRVGVTLLPNGADHHARQLHLDRALELARDILVDSPISIEQSSLAHAAAVLRAAAAAHEQAGRPLPEVHGELRDSYGHTWTLQGTFGTRAHQKRRNARLERALVHDVEPWIALAWLHGTTPGDADAQADAQAERTSSDGRIGMPQLPALLRHAWRTLLRTHPHDTLCGCSVDAVARAMDAAQEDTAAQCSGLRTSALSVALRHDVVHARSLPPDVQPRVIVRNRSARIRGGVATLRVLETIADVPVGPASSPLAPACEEDATQDGAGLTPIAESSLSFGALITQPGRVRMRHDRRESPQHYPDDDLVREYHMLAWVPPVPAHGIAMVFRDSRAQESGEAGGVQPMPRSVRVTQQGDSVRIDNGLLRLDLSRRGVWVSSGVRHIPDAIRIDTQHDAGDSYTPSLRGAPTLLEIVHVAVLAHGPLRGSCVLHWRAPGQHAKRLLARTVLSLDAESEVMRCDVVVDNRMSNHRVRLVVGTDVGLNATTWADAAFGPVRRQPILPPAHSQEVPPLTMPLHRWMSICGDDDGATLFSDGLAEGECMNGKLAVTLLRAIGELSRDDLPERPGHAGWPCDIPAAQCHGRHRATVGLLLHEAWSVETIDRIERAADDLLLPLTGQTVRDQGDLPAVLQGPALEGQGLRASAVTLSRDGQRLLLRAVNHTDEPRDGAWVLPVADGAGGRWQVTRCRLDETPLAREPDTDSRIPFTIPARGLLTLLIARVAD